MRERPDAVGGVLESVRQAFDIKFEMLLFTWIGRQALLISSAKMFIISNVWRQVVPLCHSVFVGPPA